jgi:hypothetical protein
VVVVVVVVVNVVVVLVVVVTVLMPLNDVPGLVLTMTALGPKPFGKCPGTAE